MADLEYKIRTTADVKPLQATKAALEAASKATKELGKDSAALERELKKVDAALNSQAGKAAQAAAQLNRSIAAVAKARGDVSGLMAERNATLSGGGLRAPGALRSAAGAFFDAGGGVGGLRAAGGTFGAGAGIAIGIGVAAAKLTAEFAKAEVRVTSMNAALAQHGHLVEGISEQYQELASALKFSTGIDGNQWTDVLKRLTQAGATPRDINQHVEAVKNLTAITGDLGSATVLISRAMEGQFQQFSRYGIVVREAGDETERLNKLYQDLAAKGGGQLEAQQDTITGQFKAVKFALGDIAEAAGAWTARITGAKAVLFGLGQTAKAIAGFISPGAIATDTLTNKITSNASAAREAAEALDRYGRSAEGAVRGVDALRDAIQSTNDALRAQARLQDEEEDSEMADQLSGIDESVRVGRMTEAQGTVARNRVRNEYRGRRFLRQQEGLRERISGAEMGRDRATEEMDILTRRAQGFQQLQDQRQAWEEEIRRARVEKRNAEIDLRAAFERSGNPGIDTGDIARLQQIALDPTFGQPVPGGWRDPNAPAARDAAGRLRDADSRLSGLAQRQPLAAPTAEDIQANERAPAAIAELQRQIGNFSRIIQEANEEIESNRYRFRLDERSAVRDSGPLPGQWPWPRRRPEPNRQGAYVESFGPQPAPSINVPPVAQSQQQANGEITLTLHALNNALNSLTNDVRGIRIQIQNGAGR